MVGEFEKQDISMAGVMGCWASFMIVRTSPFTPSEAGTAGAPTGEFGLNRSLRPYGGWTAGHGQGGGKGFSRDSSEEPVAVTWATGDAS